MSDTNPIYDLIELRESAKLSLADAAVLCGLNGTQSRKTLSDWELGKRTPKESRRTKFIGYLWDSLRLRDNPDEFERVWAILVERWGWDPISDGEWQSFTNTKRPASHYELRVDEKLNLILDRLPPASSIHSTIPLQKPLRTQHFTGRAAGAGQAAGGPAAGQDRHPLRPRRHGQERPGRRGDLDPRPRRRAARRASPMASSSTPSTTSRRPAWRWRRSPAPMASTRAPAPRDAALQALAGKTALLVLDGAEAADDLPAVLAVAGSCGVLITTRRHERCAG